MIDELIKTLFAPYEFSFFKTKNGISTIDNYYLEFGKDFIKKANDSLINNQNTRIYYSENFSLNAFVEILEENYSLKNNISINYGVLIKCYKVMYDLVAYCNVLNHKSIEFKGNTVIGIKYSYKFDDYQTYEIKFALPNHSDLLLADFMSMIAIKFIFLHELGHLFNGHVYLHKISSHNESKELFMNLFNLDSNLKTIDYKTLEMDADAFSMTQLIDNIVEFWEKDNRIKTFCPKLLDLFYLIGFTLNILFLMVHDENTKDFLISNTNQLSYLDRITFVTGSLKTNVLNKFSNIDINKFDMIIEKSFSQSIIYYNNIYKKENSWFMDRSNTTSFNQVLSNWKDLRKKLIPFSRATLAP